jgi:hypothetical protein
MLIMKAFCQTCHRSLAPTANDVYICGFERTVCRDCAESAGGTCTGCGGKLQVRPSRQMRMDKECRQCKAAIARDDPAEICSYQNTYCPACAKAADHVCPACHGKLQVRPVPPAEYA